MPEIKDASDARALRETLIEANRTFQMRLTQWRAIRDRKSEAQLKSFAALLPKATQDHFVPYQTPEPDFEIETLKNLLASNGVELEVVSKSKEQAVLKKAQELEEADEALLAHTMPIQKRLDRYDAMLGDAVSVEAWDILPVGKAVAALSNREQLQLAAESGQPATDAQAAYHNAYTDNNGDHEKAYAQVMKDAAVEDGVPVRKRIIDVSMFKATLEDGTDDDGMVAVQVGMEDYETALHPCITALKDYGVTKKGNAIVVSKGGKATDADALTLDRRPADIITSGSIDLSADTGRNRVRYTQIRTREQTVILLEMAGIAKTPDSTDGTIFISFPNPFPNGVTGYYITPGKTKMRGTTFDRFEPAILPILIEAQHLNIDVSIKKALAYTEASREETQVMDTTQVKPLDPQLEPKGNQGEQGRSGPILGEIKRVETTGIDLNNMTEEDNARMSLYRTTEFFAGSGDSGESGRHLAQVQTAQLTRLVPIQAKCATTDKRSLLDIHAWVAASGRTIHIPYTPGESRPKGADTRVAEVRSITPEMAKLPVEIIVTIGAETPQAKYGRQQVSREEMAAGTYGITEHREIIGVKDPQRTEELMIEDQFVAMGVEVGKQMLFPMIQQRMQEIVDSLLPPPPPTLAPPGGMQGQLPPGQPAPMMGGAPPQPQAVGGGNPQPPPVPSQTLPDVAGAAPMAGA